MRKKKLRLKLDIRIWTNFTLSVALYTFFIYKLVYVIAVVRDITPRDCVAMLIAWLAMMISVCDLVETIEKKQQKKKTN